MCVIGIESKGTYGILKDHRWVTETLENDVLAQSLGSNEFLTLGCDGGSTLHISVDVQLVIAETPLVDDEIRCHDGGLDILDVTAKH